MRRGIENDEGQGLDIWILVVLMCTAVLAIAFLSLAYVCN